MRGPCFPYYGYPYYGYPYYGYPHYGYPYYGYPYYGYPHYGYPYYGYPYYGYPYYGYPHYGSCRMRGPSSTASRYHPTNRPVPAIRSPLPPIDLNPLPARRWAHRSLYSIAIEVRTGKDRWPG